MGKIYHYEHSKSWKKPSSETHLWSYKKTCDAALAAIEERWGVDYRIVSIKFTDKGRKTKTDRSWDNKRTWKCTHTVLAAYETELRGQFQNPSPEMPFISDSIAIEYEMQNEFHSDYSKLSENFEEEVESEELA